MPHAKKITKLLITGSQGQVGSELRLLLENQDQYQCFFLDRKQLPLDQTLLIQDILAMYEPDVIIHAAAYTQVDKAEAEAEMANLVNHIAAEEIAQYCRLQQVRLIALSTDYVFDGHGTIPLTENDPIGPLNAYGKSKLAGEQAILKWCPEAIIIRTSWVYSVFGNNFVKTMHRLMQSRDELAVVNDQFGSPTSARDLAKLIVDQLVPVALWVPGLYHYSNEGIISWFDFATAIKEALHASCLVKGIPSREYTTAAIRPMYTGLDKSKIINTFGIRIPHWKESLGSMLQELTASETQQ